MEVDEIAAELLELNHPFVRDLAVAHGFTYATARNTAWFLKMVTEELLEEFESLEDAVDELELYD